MAVINEFWGEGLIAISPSIFGKKIIRMAKNGDKFFRNFRHNGENGKKINGKNGKNGEKNY